MTPNPRKTLSIKIKTLRKTKDLTQEKLAEICNVSWRTISNLERGAVVPGLELICNLSNLEHNIRHIKELCDKNHVFLAGVIKGFNGIPEIALKYDQLGLPIIASSRLDQLEPLKGKVKAKLMTIRIPMLSEVEDVIRITDIS